MSNEILFPLPLLTTHSPQLGDDHGTPGDKDQALGVDHATLGVDHPTLGVFVPLKGQICSLLAKFAQSVSF